MCAGMRWERSLLSFYLTLSMGLGIGMRFSVTDWFWPSFTKKEAYEMLGHRFRFHRSEKFVMMKCLLEQPCLVVSDGESGTVIGIEPEHDGGYSLKIRWDQQTQHYISYFGRYTHRESLDEQ
jgi:hypothetical protein